MTTPSTTGQQPLNGVKAHVDPQGRLVLLPPIPVISIPGHFDAEDIKVELESTSVTITVRKA
ncbi:MAG TPA: hypothetical protein VF271_07285 [Rhodanobacteraceae bacterium]